MVFDVDTFDEIPDAPPNDNDAITKSALADVAGLFNATRITKVVPAMYVQLPVRFVKLVIVSAACAFTFMLKLEPEAVFNTLAEISSDPEAVALIVTA